MDEINPTDAEARLGALLDRVDAGESILITRNGRPVALLSPVPRPRRPVDLVALRALTVTMATKPGVSRDSVRSIRESERY